MSNLNFTAIKEVSGIYKLNGNVPTINKYSWVGYISGKDCKLGDIATLEEIWTDLTGVYIILPEAPDDFVVFTSSLKKYLMDNPVKFVWVKEPNNDLTIENICSLSAIYQNNTNTWGVSSPATFSLNSSYHLLINSGCEITLCTDSEKECFKFSGNSINFKSNNYLYPSKTDPEFLLNSENLGTFQFDIELINGWKERGDMSILGVKLCYSLLDPNSINKKTSSMDMPLLKQMDSSIIDMALSMDILNPMVAERTFLSFKPLKSDIFPKFQSSLSTTKGYNIHLAPAVMDNKLWSGRLAFGKTPQYCNNDEINNSYNYHLSPDGLFSISIDAPQDSNPMEYQFMLGISGTESVDIKGNNIPLLFYKAGQPAFISTLKDGSLGLLTVEGTTSYGTILPSESKDDGYTYFAQPIQAPLFKVSSSKNRENLDFHQMPGGKLPLATDNIQVMPMGAYKWVKPNDLDLVKMLEDQVFSKERRKIIPLPTKKGNKIKLLKSDANPHLAVTPNGLVAKLTDDKNYWRGIVLGNMPDSVHKEIQFTEVKTEFQKGLQANQLFFVVSNAETFMEQSSVQYQLTEENIKQLTIDGVSTDFLTIIRNAYKVLPTQIYNDEDSFLKPYPKNDGTNKDYINNKKLFLAITGLLITDMDGWTFRLSPRSWRTDKNSPTIMLFKFCNQSITNLIKVPNSWGWQEAAWDSNHSLTKTKGILSQIVKYAKERNSLKLANDPFSDFYSDVLNNPMWNGVLFLNAPIDNSDLPQELEFISAGINDSEFYAHHIGFSVTPFTPKSGGLELKQTAAFGLIHYNDREDLVASETVPFGYKTMQLQVQFANAHISSFSAKVELMINDLFGSPLSNQEPARGNNLIMLGSLQKSGGTPSYSFFLIGENKYNVQNAALLGVEILSIDLKTGGKGELDTIVTQFTLTGNMRFVDFENFDLYSFGPSIKADESKVDGYLRFSGLDIIMTFNRYKPEIQNFIVNQGATAFDLINSRVRESSLVDNFPLILSNFIVSPNLAKEGDPVSGQSPEDMGYTSISCPIDQTPMGGGWAGLVFDLDLGTLGALAGSSGLKVSLLTAWAPGSSTGDKPVYLGLKIPSIPAIGGSIPIQGVLKIGFRSFEFSTYSTKDNKIGYILALNRFALSILSFSFPPGNNSLKIFGAPGDEKSSVGWFAAYDDGSEDATVKDTKLLSGRRTPLAESL